MERYGRSGEEGSRSDPSGQTGVQGKIKCLVLICDFGTVRLKDLVFEMNVCVLVASVWRGGGESYPERPDEPDCIYYLRTGACGYGSRCRFNHPRDRGAVIKVF